MENLISLGMIEKNEHLLVPRIFTRLQLNTLKKRLRQAPLNANEKTYYYKYIKPKIRVMLSLFSMDELNIHGREYMLENRIPKAARVLSRVSSRHRNKRIMISGSFLFSRKYNDIDVFVFTKYNKEDYRKGRVHVVFLPESSLGTLFFSSLSQISISNFAYEAKTDFDLDLNNLLQAYEVLINHMLNKDECPNELRDFLLKTEYASKKVILNPKQLYELKSKLEHRKSSGILSSTFINTLLLGYEQRSLKEKLKEQISHYASMLGEYKSAPNLKAYIQTYEQVIKLES